jgi:hypothetical protein
MDTKRQRSRQLHVWLTDSEYRYLQEVATSLDQTITVVVRRLIRNARARESAAPRQTNSGTHKYPGS